MVVFDADVIVAGAGAGAAGSMLEIEDREMAVSQGGTGTVAEAR